MMLAVIAAAAWQGPAVNPAAASQSRAAALTMGAAIKGTKANAQAQMDAYFEMAPWEKPVTIAGYRGASATDLRALTSFDKSSAVVVPVFANQEGLPPLGVWTGDMDKALARGDAQQWRVIGCITAEDEASLSAAVARQRDLIEAWAYELIRDKKTDVRIFKRGPLAPPIELAWAYPPAMLKKMFIKGYLGDLNVVPRDTPVVDDVRCGFVGSQSRTQRSNLDDPSKGGYRYVPIELPK